MNFLLFFSLNTFQTISILTTVIFLSFSTIRSQISSLKLYAILVSLFFSKLAANDRDYRDWETDRKSTRLNSSHRSLSRMPSSA